MVFELLVTSGVLVLFRLCRELLTERARRATICRVARTLDRGGLVLDMRACGSTTVICVPEPGPTRPGSPDDRPAA
jgi:hypothetical protein